MNTPEGEPESTASRSRAVLIAVGLAFGAVVAAVVAIVLLGGGGTDANQVYRQKLTATLAPVLAANRACRAACSHSAARTRQRRRAPTRKRRAPSSRRAAPSRS